MTSEFALFDMGADTYSGGHCGGSIRGGLVLTFFYGLPISTNALVMELTTLTNDHVMW